MHNFPLLTTIAAAFAAAWVLGIITQKLKLSPIVGYLLAGVAIGRYTPGFVGDIDLAGQLGEVGVILLMFGVGMHFHLKDLLAVKRIAIPGAVVQSLVATIVTVVVFHFFGWSVKSGIVLGMAMAVASTVVLLRVLMDKEMLKTEHGHVAVGWLIVEDIFTVLALVLVPVLASGSGGEGADPAHAAGGGWTSILWAIGKLVALVAIVLLAGSRVVPWVLTQVAKLRSRELFTLTVLVLSIAIAVGSAVFFGASVALGAFLAGMVVAQSPVSHQAAADALPMRDAFAVLFFVSVGMLFDPGFIALHPWMVVAGLGVVLLVKPITAMLIVGVLGYSARTALTVAIGLAQIGEFSFILSHVAHEHGLLSEDGHSLLVATAMISITINPLLFGSIGRVEGMMRARPWLWKIVNGRAQKRLDAINANARPRIAAVEKPLAVIVGYGPVGRLVDALLRDSGMETVVIEMNMDTVLTLQKSGRGAIYGDASLRDVLAEAGVAKAVHLVVTLPQSSNRVSLVLAAKELNPSIEVTVRARYLAEQEPLRHVGVSKTVSEEGEAGLALARHVMERRGVETVTVEKLLGAVRSLWKMDVHD